MCVEFITQVTHKAVFFAFSIFAALHQGLLDVHVVEGHPVVLQRVIKPPQEGGAHWTQRQWWTHTLFHHRGNTLLNLLERILHV